MTIGQAGLDFARGWEACKRLRAADLAGVTQGLRGLPLEVARCVLDRLHAAGRLEEVWEAGSEAERERFHAVTASLGWARLA